MAYDVSPAMADDTDIDVERILAEVRARVRRRDAGRTGLDRTVPIAERQAVGDLAALQAHANLQAVRFPTDRRLLGWLAVGVKRVLVRLLFPVLRRQVEYNEANARLVWYLKERLEQLERAQASRREAAEARGEPPEQTLR